MPWAALQACHELVPPDAMTAVLRQLVDAFVHDRARPEVMTLGLKTVRELCARMPLIMTADLLQVTAHSHCSPAGAAHKADACGHYLQFCMCLFQPVCRACHELCTLRKTTAEPHT